MEFKAHFAQIVGTPTETYDSWVLAEQGLFLVTAISSPTEFPLASFGKEILAKIREDYHGLAEKNLANLKNLVQNLDTKEADFSLVLCIQKETACYVLCRGGGRVILKRGEKFGIILEEKESSSGFLQNNDIIILTSPKFNELVTFDEIKSACSTTVVPGEDLTISELAESLTSLLHRAPDTSGAACLILKFTAALFVESSERTEEETQEMPPAAIDNTANKLEIIKGKLLSLRSRFHLPVIKLSRLPVLYLRFPQDEQQKKKRLTFGVAIVLIVLLLISVVFGINKRKDSTQKQHFNEIYGSALQKYQEGKGLAGVNNQQAVVLLGDARVSLLELKKSSSQNSSEVKKIDELISQIGQALEAASQTYKINPQVFFDLGLLKENGQGVKMANTSDSLIIIDSKNLSLYQINIQSKKGKIIGGGDELTGYKQLAGSEESIYLLVGKGILKCQISSAKCKITIENDKDWGEIVDMAEFGGNLYLLDKTNSKIWKYTGSESGYSTKTNYLAKETSLGSVSSMKIDGVVWLAAEKMRKFVRGEEENFSPQGISQPFGQKLKIYTSEDSKNLYILDNSSSRVIVLDKTGIYQSQYVWEGMGEITDLVVSEEEKKIFLLAGSKIFEIGLK